MEPWVCGDGRPPAGPTRTPPGGARGCIIFFAGEPGGSPEPVSGTATVQSQTAGDGYHDVGPLLLTLYGGTVKERARHGAEHGGAPPHGSAPLPKSVLPAGVAGV